MLHWTAALWGVGAAFAGTLQVEDPSSCLDREAFDLEVRQVLGDPVVDRLDLAVTVSEVAAGTRAPLAVAVIVAEEGALVWERSLEVTSSDCPFLAPLLARSVERGLADVPGWGVGVGRRRAPTEASLQFSVSGPGTFRGDFGPVVGVALVGPLQMVGEVYGLFTGVQVVGSGGAQLLGPSAAVGPGVWIPIDRHALRLAVTAGGGPVLVLGRNFDRNEQRWVFRVAARQSLSWCLPTDALPLRVGLSGELPLVSVDFIDLDTGAKVSEPPYRLGVHVGLGGILSRQ